MYQITITQTQGGTEGNGQPERTRNILAVETEDIDLEAIVKAIFGLKRTRGPSKAVKKAK